VLFGKDIFFSPPTGHGKSLICLEEQFPAEPMLFCYLAPEFTNLNSDNFAQEDGDQRLQGLLTINLIWFINWVDNVNWPP